MVLEPIQTQLVIAIVTGILGFLISLTLVIKEMYVSFFFKPHLFIEYYDEQDKRKDPHTFGPILWIIDTKIISPSAAIILHSVWLGGLLVLPPLPRQDGSLGFALQSTWACTLSSKSTATVAITTMLPENLWSVLIGLSSAQLQAHRHKET
jgi:hypothetical protein